MDIDIVELALDEVELTRKFRVTAVYSIHQNLNNFHDVMNEISGQSHTVNLQLSEFYHPMIGYVGQLEEIIESASEMEMESESESESSSGSSGSSGSESGSSGSESEDGDDDEDEDEEVDIIDVPAVVLVNEGVVGPATPDR